MSSSLPSFNKKHIFSYVGLCIHQLLILEAVHKAEILWIKKKSMLCVTWTLDSGRLILRATSSLMKMSGYRVLENRASRMSSCARVKVVRSRRCLRGVSAEKTNTNIIITITDE